MGYELNPYFIIAFMVGDNNAALLIDTVKATLACTVPTETKFNILPLWNAGKWEPHRISM